MEGKVLGPGLGLEVVRGLQVRNWMFFEGNIQRREKGVSRVLCAMYQRRRLFRAIRLQKQRQIGGVKMTSG